MRYILVVLALAACTPSQSDINACQNTTGWTVERCQHELMK